MLHTFLLYIYDIVVSAEQAGSVNYGTIRHGLDASFEYLQYTQVFRAGVTYGGQNS